MNDKTIIDKDGNAISSTKVKNRIAQMVTGNELNAVSVIVGLVTVIYCGMSKCASIGYANTCREYYGVSARYFDGTDLLNKKTICIIAAAILLIYPFISVYINQKIKNKNCVDTVISFFIVATVLLEQNIMYTSLLTAGNSEKWIKTVLDSPITVGVFIISDVIIAYFLIVKRFFWNREKVNKVKTMIFAIALGIYLVDMFMGMGIIVNTGIADKKSYEMLGKNNAIITEYNGLFLVMNCKVVNKSLIIKKGKYHFEEMTDKEIEYVGFDEVSCR